MHITREKILIKIVNLFGYKNLFTQKDGILTFVGNKYDDKGWCEFSINFRKYACKKYFKGNIDKIYIFNKKPSEEQVNKLHSKIWE